MQSQNYHMGTICLITLIIVMLYYIHLVEVGRPLSQGQLYVIMTLTLDSRPAVVVNWASRLSEIEHKASGPSSGRETQAS